MGMDPSEITGPGDDKLRKAERLGEKKARGETLTREEAGFLGAVGAMEKGAREQKEAAREGRHEEYEEEHRTKSWMKGEDTRAPEPTDETRDKVEAIREKQSRGETLTREEAGTLGGAARADDA